MAKFKKHIKIGENEWDLVLDANNSLSFLIKEKNLELTKSGLWQDWGSDSDTGDSYWTVDPKDKLDGVTALKFFRVLLEEVPKLIKRSGVSYFTFSPNTLKKKNLYEKIADKILPDLPGDWTYQIADNHFYFHQN